MEIGSSAHRTPPSPLLLPLFLPPPLLDVRHKNGIISFRLIATGGLRIDRRGQNILLREHRGAVRQPGRLSRSDLPSGAVQPGARAKDIADQMNVQRASVTGALKALSGRGLINYSPYSFITLTTSGRDIARDVIRRHRALERVFYECSSAQPGRRRGQRVPHRTRHRSGGCRAPGAISRIPENLSQDRFGLVRRFRPFLQTRPADIGLRGLLETLRREAGNGAPREAGGVGAARSDLLSGGMI